MCKLYLGKEIFTTIVNPYEWSTWWLVFYDATIVNAKNMVMNWLSGLKCFCWVTSMNIQTIAGCNLPLIPELPGMTSQYRSTVFRVQAGNSPRSGLFKLHAFYLSCSQCVLIETGSWDCLWLNLWCNLISKLFHFRFVY